MFGLLAWPLDPQGETDLHPARMMTRASARRDARQSQHRARRRELSVTVTVGVAEDDGRIGPSPGGPWSGDAFFVDSLVARLHAEYGVDGELIRRLATDALEAFATARVQAFVPVLVEKTLRDRCRALRDGRTPPPAGALDSGPGRWAAAGRHRR
jgi:hypothetical protein